MGWGNAFAFLPYGEEQRRQRAHVQPTLSPKGVATYLPLIQKHVEVLVTNLSISADDFRAHIRQ